MTVTQGRKDHPLLVHHRVLSSLAAAFAAAVLTSSWCQPARSFLLHPQLPTTTRLHPMIGKNVGVVCAVSGNSSDGGGGSSSDHLSAAARERRDEERRRRERAGDVVIGQTSAVPTAKDYELNIKATERDLMGQSSDVEREVHLQTERGLECLKMLELEEARAAFDRVYELKPTAYLWQAGLVLFYLNDVHAAGVCFAKNAQIYERRFGEPASEERIWRDACHLKLLSSLPRKDRRRMEEGGGGRKGDGEEGGGAVPHRVEQLVPEIPTEDENSYHYKRETRKVLRIVRDLFDASVSSDHSRVILSRAKLRAIAGDPGRRGGRQRPDPKQWKLSSWYYLGLHYDAMGEADESKKCMKNAVMRSVGGKSDDVIHCLPVLHMARRDWFDDDEIDDDGVGPGVDSELVESIRDSVNKMMMSDIQDALKRKSLKSSGSKVALQQRLFECLLEEAQEGPDYSI